MTQPLLQVRDLTTRFSTYEGVVQALDRVSFAVNHGETFGLVGESGCGKSATVRSVMRIVQPPGKIESGEVWFHERPGGPGVELLSQSEDRMRRLRGDALSMIFQEPAEALNPVMTVGEQVAESFLFHRMDSLCRSVLDAVDAGQGRRYGLSAKLFSFAHRTGAENPEARSLRLMDRLPLLKLWRRAVKREALRRAADMVGRLGVANPEAVCAGYPHNLSGGMKQRIVIAMALACSPTLLIADEATSNLDVTIQAQILALLNELKQGVISSALLITHELGVVAETCDRVGVMYAGTMAEQADAAALFARPRHPYTQALLASAPRLCADGELAVIDGAVPDLIHPPDGCRFHPRCPYADGVCRTVRPELRDVGDGHLAACHHVDRVGGA